MFIGKKFIAIFLVMILSAFAVVPAYAAGAAGDRSYGDEELIDDLDDKEFSWEKDGDTWVCRDSSGEPVTGWVKRNSDRYFLNKNGEMRTGWIKYQGKWYYLYTEEDAKDKTIDKAQIGTLAKNTWIDNYYVDEDGVQTKIKK